MKRKILLVISVLMILVLACSISGGSDTPAEQPPEELPQAEQPPEEEPPQEEPPIEEPPRAPDVSCAGISFSYDDALAANVTCNQIPASLGSDDSPPWDIYPAHRQFNFESYVLQDTFHDPRIMVYPIPEYEGMNEWVEKDVFDLRQLLINRPANPDFIPFLPPFGAAQMMRTQTEYFEFQNGIGVRFLTQYGQALYMVNNESLFYTFQGITTDGQYYVSAIFPVSHPDLPPNGNEVPDGDWDTFAQNFETYITETQNLMDGYPNESYLPDLSLLDELIQSLLIE